MSQLICVSMTVPFPWDETLWCSIELAAFFQCVTYTDMLFWVNLYLDRDWQLQISASLLKLLVESFFFSSVYMKFLDYELMHKRWEQNIVMKTLYSCDQFPAAQVKSACLRFYVRWLCNVCILRMIMSLLDFLKQTSVSSIFKVFYIGICGQVHRNKMQCEQVSTSLKHPLIHFIVFPIDRSQTFQKVVLHRNMSNFIMAFKKDSLIFTSSVNI